MPSSAGGEKDLHLLQWHESLSWERAALIAKIHCQNHCIDKPLSQFSAETPATAEESRCHQSDELF
jgi:hypothetical protein